MTGDWTWLIIAMVLAVGLLGYSLLAISARDDQADEDRYGDKARRS